MNLETALSPTLEQTLNLIISSLANFFGTTTEAIMTNAPIWLAKYGLFITLKKLGLVLVIGALLCGIVVAIVFAFLDNLFNKRVVILIFCIFLFLILMAIVIGVALLPCIIAPEIVGLEAAFDLIQ